MKTWVDNEVNDCQLPDKRLNKRFKLLLQQLSDGIGRSIPFSCQDWANTKAAYRFFAHENFDEKDILKNHFQSTLSRFQACQEKMLVLQDTTQFTFTRKKVASFGATHRIGTAKMPDGRYKMHMVRGILMHSSLAITTDGLPLGLAAIKFWTRKRFKGCEALKRKINPTRVSIKKKESFRWIKNLEQSTLLFNNPDKCIHVGDRESDIYELFCKAKELRTHFLIRRCVDRLACDGKHTIEKEIKSERPKGSFEIKIRNKKGKEVKVNLEVKYKNILIFPPIGKQSLYANLYLTVIEAKEKNPPKNRERIHWKLITDLEVKSFKEAVEKIRWYSLRWKIENFHKILKSGCKAQESKLRTAERLVKLIAVFCLIGWRIFWMTMLNRLGPNAPPKMALNKVEISLLNQLMKNKPIDDEKQNRLSHYLIKIAKLGGYLARKHDPPPGNIVMWRGLSRLIDIELGFSMGKKLMGN